MELAVFSQNGRKLFPGKVSPKFPGKMSRKFFLQKFFLQKFFLQNFPSKLLRHKLCKSLIYRLQPVIRVCIVSNIVVKFCGENFPSGEFREIRETSRRENFSPEFTPRFSGIFGKTLCKPVLKNCVRKLPGEFLYKFPRHFWRNCGENFFRGKFLPKVSSAIIVS